MSVMAPLLLNCWFRRRSRKTSKLPVTGLREGNSPVTGEFPTQKARDAENVCIWWRHHDEKFLWSLSAIISMSSFWGHYMGRNQSLIFHAYHRVLRLTIWRHVSLRPIRIWVQIRRSLTCTVYLMKSAHGCALFWCRYAIILVGPRYTNLFLWIHVTLLPYGSSHLGATVLLPGFAIKW